MIPGVKKRIQVSYFPCLGGDVHSSDPPFVNSSSPCSAFVVDILFWLFFFSSATEGFALFQKICSIVI